MADDPNRCTARKGRSRCSKLRDEHREHHDLLTDERWEGESWERLYMTESQEKHCIKLVFENGLLLTEGPDNDYIWDGDKLVIHRYQLPMLIRHVSRAQIKVVQISDATEIPSAVEWVARDTREVFNRKG